MKRVRNTARLLLLTCLILTGVRCEKDPLFTLSTVGGDVYLPCNDLLTSDCSQVSWNFFYKGRRVDYTMQVNKGEVMKSSEKAERLSLMSNCTLLLKNLQPKDAGSYVCLLDGNVTTDIYLSVLGITSGSSITELQPGGNLNLSCVIFTYFDAGSCKPYSNIFNLSWTSQDGTALLQDPRYKMISTSRCSTTLMVSNLQRKDNNRRLRCRLSTKNNPQAVHLDFRPMFLFGASAVHSVTPSADGACPQQLPISRIVLCVALPIMVFVVGFFTWRGDKKREKMAAEVIEVHELR